jgi:hypothetical protein
MHPAVPSASAPSPPVVFVNEWTSCSVQEDTFVGMPTQKAGAKTKKKTTKKYKKKPSSTM